MQPFNLLKATFLLLAVVVLAELGLVVFAGAGCFAMILRGTVPLGSCSDMGQQIREIFAELLAVVLALLLAGRTPPPPPPADPGAKTGE